MYTAGRNITEEFKAPSRTNKVPREVPQVLAWYKHPLAQLFMVPPPTYIHSYRCTLTTYIQFLGWIFAVLCDLHRAALYLRQHLGTQDLHSLRNLVCGFRDVGDRHRLHHHRPALLPTGERGSCTIYK